MKKEVMKCPICQRKIIVNTWIARKGILKGYKIVDLWVHKSCEDLFYEKIEREDRIEKYFESVHEIRKEK